jgi:hypothetical protein
MRNLSASALRPSFSWLGVLPAALIVALSLPACSSDSGKSGTSTDQNGTDPACRPSTCSTLRKNCGIVADGCGGSLRCGTCAGSNNDCRENVCERGCTGNGECPNGTACVAGSCTDKCSTSQDCPSGQYCSAGSCLAKAPETCNYDADCRADERCLGGQCIGEVSGTRSCNRDSDCGSAEACRNSTCTAVNGRGCYKNADCRSDESCLSGYCSRNAGSTCFSDHDCRSHENCSHGVCRNDNGRRVRAECVTREIGLSLPFGSVTFYSESWLYDSANPNGMRVESCICQSNGVMKLDLGESNRSISCNSCIKDEAVRTCYE